MLCELGGVTCVVCGLTGGWLVAWMVWFLWCVVYAMCDFMVCSLSVFFLVC